MSSLQRIFSLSTLRNAYRSPLQLSFPANHVKRHVSDSTNAVSEEVRRVMRKVPQPVVVVTTADSSSLTGSDIRRRGLTVSSFTPICLHPEPLVSFCVRVPSRASELLHRSGNMVVNVLSHEQVRQSVAFSSPDKTDQFKDIPFYDDPTTGLPVLMGTLGSMHCNVVQVLKFGDHELWITRVVKVDHGVGSKYGRREEAQPLLYHDRRYRSIGEQVFMKAFEDSMDARLWTHRAHVRMAWNYLRELGREEATPMIKETIRRHFERNPSRHQEYHETITSFYIHLVDLALQQQQDDEEDFFEFVERFPELADCRTIYTYYSCERLKSDEARREFLPPDLEPLPNKLNAKESTASEGDTST